MAPTWPPVKSGATISSMDKFIPYSRSHIDRAGARAPSGCRLAAAVLRTGIRHGGRGGVTRLTRSACRRRVGTLMGAIPPLNQGDWERNCSTSTSAPRVPEGHKGMSLEAFKAFLGSTSIACSAVSSALVFVPCCVMARRKWRRRLRRA